MLSRIVVFCIAIICCGNLCLTPQVAYAQDLYAPIEKILQDEGYVPHLPLSDTIHPGGLAKLCGKSKTYDFIPLAPGAKVADTTAATFSWPASNTDKKTTVSLLLSAISGILSGVNISANAGGDQTINLNEIDAGGIALTYDPVSVIQADPVLRKEIRDYQTNCAIFLVTQVGTTNALTFKTDKSVSASIHVNDASADGTCAAPPAPDPAAAAAKAAATPKDTTAPKNTAPTAAKPATAPAAPSPAAAAIAAALKDAADAVAPTAASAKPASPANTGNSVAALLTKPSAHLSACVTDSNQITLNSPKPLTFVVKLEPLNKLAPELPAPAPVSTAAPAADAGVITATMVAAALAADTTSPIVTLSDKPVVTKGAHILSGTSPTAAANTLGVQVLKANNF
jgi:hypothetical protein